MKALFMTSQLPKLIKDENGNKISDGCNNQNGIVERLKAFVNNSISFVYIASNPNNFSKSDSQCQATVKALEKEGFSVDKIELIDYRFDGDINKTILSSNIVFLAGGHVPTQNKYFKEIDLKSILKDFDGVVIGQSAGSMNCSKMVYAQPYNEEEFNDPNYQNTFEGLGLTDLIIMPHMNRAKLDELCGETTYSMCLKDSYIIPHYGIVDGGYILVKDGKAEAFGKTVFFENGKETLICENGESYVIYEKGKEDEKNN